MNEEYSYFPNEKLIDEFPESDYNYLMKEDKPPPHKQKETHETEPKIKFCEIMTDVSTWIV
jgi:hypothetical protein